MKIWYELVRPKKVVERAFADLIAKVEKAAKQKVLWGLPE